jgi:ATP-dependent RNA helicase DDX1
VLDEADSLIDTSIDIINKIYRLLPKTNALQVLMFSATLHSDKVKQLGNEICRFPTWVDLKGKDAVPEVEPSFLSSSFLG